MRYDPGTEAEALESQSDLGAADDCAMEETIEWAENLPRQIRQMRQRYQVAKQAKAGEKIVCPTCGLHFVKKSYQQAFCSNGKTKGKNCKDKYWNLTDDTRRQGMMVMSPDMRQLQEYVDDHDGIEYDNGPRERAGVFLEAMNGSYNKQVQGPNVEDIIAKLRKQPPHVLELIEKMLK